MDLSQDSIQKAHCQFSERSCQIHEYQYAPEGHLPRDFCPVNQEAEEERAHFQQIKPEN